MLHRQLIIYVVVQDAMQRHVYLRDPNVLALTEWNIYDIKTVCTTFTYLGVNMQPALSTTYEAGSPLLKLTHRGYVHFLTISAPTATPAPPQCHYLYALVAYHKWQVYTHYVALSHRYIYICTTRVITTCGNRVGQFLTTAEPTTRSFSLLFLPNLARDFKSSKHGC